MAPKLEGGDINRSASSLSPPSSFDPFPDASLPISGQMWKLRSAQLRQNGSRQKKGGVPRSPLPLAFPPFSPSLLSGLGVLPV